MNKFWCVKWCVLCEEVGNFWFIRLLDSDLGCKLLDSVLGCALLDLVLDLYSHLCAISKVKFNNMDWGMRELWRKYPFMGLHRRGRYRGTHPLQYFRYVRDFPAIAIAAIAGRVGQNPFPIFPYFVFHDQRTFKIALPNSYLVETTGMYQRTHNIYI